jgi:hypothetical protein
MTEAAMAEHKVPDLHDVEEKIRAAHEAEDRLMHTMPSAIHPDDSAYPGMVPPSASPAASQENVEEQPEPDDRVPGEAGEQRDEGEEPFVESTAVEDDSPRSADPDHR